MEQVGNGSGVIMHEDGDTAYIITNNHVAENAKEILVTLADGREIDNATVVGTDPKTDLAVVKIKADHLPPPAAWGDSDQLHKGDLVLAFGSPFGYIGSMTHGIVRACPRSQQRWNRLDGRDMRISFRSTRRSIPETAGARWSTCTAK